MLPTSESYVPRRYRFDPGWIVPAHVAIAMALRGPGQCKGRTTGSFNRTTFDGALAKLKQFKNLIRFRLAGLQWWDHDAVPFDLVALQCTEIQLKKGNKPASVENLLDGASYAACLLIGYPLDWRTVLPETFCRLELAKVVTPATANVKGKGRIPQKYLDAWGDRIQGMRVRGTAKYGTDRWLQWGGTKPNAQARRDSREYEIQYRFYHAAIMGDACGARSSEYLETKKETKPSKRCKIDGRLIGSALKISNFVTPTATAPVHGRMASVIIDQKCKSNYSLLIFDRRTLAHRDPMKVTADRHGFPRTDDGVRLLMAWKDSPAAHRIGAVPWFSSPKNIDVSVMYRKIPNRPRRHQLVNSATYNCNIKKFLRQTADCRPDIDWDDKLIREAASHGHRKEFAFREFMKAIRGTGDAHARLQVLATRLRWKSEDMIRLYSTYSHGQLSAILDAIDATDAKAAQQNYGYAPSCSPERLRPGGSAHTTTTVRMIWRSALLFVLVHFGFTVNVLLLFRRACEVERSVFSPQGNCHFQLQSPCQC